MSREMGATIFFGSDRIGAGDDALGEVLMRSAVKTLGALDPLPNTLLFMNAGVRLCCEGSDALDALRELESLGLEVLCCGTCLDWFHLKDELAVGRPSNMLEILSRQNSAQNLIRL